jgi:PAS domain S-box-containing protein
MESFNPAAENIFGYQAEECIGQNVKMLMPDPDRTAHDGYIHNYLDTGHAKIIGIGREVVGLHRDGREFPMDLSVGQFRLGDQIMFVGICRDVTVRRREQDEIIAVNKELESFSYSVSHDLRAPLRAIDGFSQALLEDYGDKIDEDGLGYISRVRAAAQRMGRLIDDLLNLSRVTRRDLVRESVNLSEMASQIADEMRSQYPDRRVVFEIDPGLRTNGDSHLLKIALENLLGNAWKYTAGMDSAHIAFTSEIDGSMRNFIIRDNGAGFNQEYADKLFEPFQRLHTVREFEGSGIGLATVARIIHRHGGEIWGEGMVGEGASFYFRISA